LEEILKVKDENKEAVWTWWTVCLSDSRKDDADEQDERDREQWEEFQDTWQKRRRLIREKGDLEHVPSKRRECTSLGGIAERGLMVAKAIPKSWTDMPKPLDWAAGAVPAPMSASDAASDLAKMDVSNPPTFLGNKPDSSHAVITLLYPSLTPAKALRRDTQLHQPITPIHLPLHHTLSTQKKVSNIPNTPNEFQPHQHHITQYIA
jgi:hypothetical protein